MEQGLTPSNGEPSTAERAKLCPFCAEEIKAAAIKCKHCASDLSEGAGQFTCLVCQNRYPAGASTCPQCGAEKGKNFVIASGQRHAPPQDAGRIDVFDPLLGFGLTTLLIGGGALAYGLGLPTFGIILMVLGGLIALGLLGDVLDVI